METTTQNKTLNYAIVKNHIADWLKNYATNANQKGYIIGVSGGIDSAVCSTLCAMTGLPLTVVKMSIHQAADQADRGTKHIEWLKANFPNVKSLDVDLTEVYDKEIELLAKAGAFDGVSADNIFLTSANTRSRLRMITLYGVAGAHKLLVCGTGNKVEDFGIGFFTKYGDGGIDISPIGELLKSETYSLGKELGIIEEILNARPTDGLWDDGRTDEDQIGATYDELEWAMNFCETAPSIEEFMAGHEPVFFVPLSERQRSVIRIYWKRHTANAHKMIMPPICDLSKLR
jgi:NAD+ synthase